MADDTPGPLEGRPPAPAADETLDEFTEKLAAFNMLRKSDETAANAVLEQLGGGRGKVERDIVFQLAVPQPLYRPDEFDLAHRRAMRALEVLHRNGHRPAPLKAPGPLKPLGGYVQQQTCRFIVRSHLNSVIDNLHNLYLAREGQCRPGSQELVSLRRARMHISRVSGRFKGKALGLPTFLLGGAAISSALAGLRRLVDSVTSNDIFLAVATALILAVFVGLAWTILRSAGVARRRIRMTTDQPLESLYATVGAAGNPPKDQARMFALVAVILLALVWVIVPVALFAVFTN